MIKDAMIPGSLFSQMGFEYLGPADGHDVVNVAYLLRRAAAMKKPVLIHLITKKGRGYTPSELNPGDYHGVGQFCIPSGEALGCAKPSYSSCFGESLVELAEADRRIVAVTAAMQTGCGLDIFARRFPKRFFDAGIAEGHAVTMAAAMAKQGLRPVVALYSTFLQRAYDQIIHDVAIQNLPVVFAVGSAGLCGEDGETHHGVFDPLFLTGIPNMNLWSPAGFEEMRLMLAQALKENGPVAIRYPKNGGGELISLPDGRQATIVAYGAMTGVAAAAAKLLEEQGISAGVVKVTSLKPLEEVKTKGKVFILEDNPGYLCRHMKGIPLNTGDRFIPHGTTEELLAYCGLDAKSVANAIAGSL
jgi:1-deoxy-D-xylulose-5-phosphate synthase